MGRDKSGRQTTILFGDVLADLVSSKTVRNCLRAQYYVIMKALQSEETQTRGIVSLFYAIGNSKMKPLKGFFETFTAGEALPRKGVAYHLCTDDMREYVLVSGGVKAMQANLRARMKVHFGSLTECQYQLSTYGIFPQSLPLDARGNINLDQHLHWIQSCAMDEKFGRSAALKASEFAHPTSNANEVLFAGSTTKHVGIQRFRALTLQSLNDYDSASDSTSRMTKLIEPGPNDVLLGRGSGNFLHPGNVQFREFLKDCFQEDYDNAPRYTRLKYAEITMLLLKKGVRFLKRAESGDGWVESDFAEAEEKVKQLFRSQKKLNDKRKKSGDYLRSVQ